MTLWLFVRRQGSRVTPRIGREIARRGRWRLGGGVGSAHGERWVGLAPFQRLTGPGVWTKKDPFRCSTGGGENRLRSGRSGSSRRGRYGYDGNRGHDSVGGYYGGDVDDGEDHELSRTPPDRPAHVKRFFPATRVSPPPHYSLHNPRRPVSPPVNNAMSSPTLTASLTWLARHAGYPARRLPREAEL